MELIREEDLPDLLHLIDACPRDKLAREVVRYVNHVMGERIAGATMAAPPLVKPDFTPLEFRGLEAAAAAGGMASAAPMMSTNPKFSMIKPPAGGFNSDMLEDLRKQTMDAMQIANSEKFKAQYMTEIPKAPLINWDSVSSTKSGMATMMDQQAERDAAVRLERERERLRRERTPFVEGMEELSEE